MHRTLALALTLLATPALAQQPVPGSEPVGTEPAGPQPTGPIASPTGPRPEGLRTEYRFDGVAPRVKDRRAFAMEFSFRSRLVSIPKTLLDIWYYDIEDPNWAYIERRPRVVGYALGVEWVIKNKGSNGIFYAEFMDSQMSEGYWDDVEEPPDHLDGDFLAPSPGFGLVTFGADYAYEAHFVRTRDTQGRFGLSFLVGGGLGMGIMTGRLDRWGPDSEGNPAYKRYLDGIEPDEDKRLPRVYPMVDVNAGLRFNIADRVVFRTETGLHSVVYYGATAGVMF